jgi:glycosyltransferase involved in cell wall biosynthesis
VIPNPVKIPSFRINEISERENVATAVLRFAPVKQLEKMVTIWERFTEKFPDWKLHLYGAKEGDYYEKIQKLVEEKNLKILSYSKEKPMMLPELNNAKLLLMTSEQECFPMVILEAHSCGVPVVSFDAPTYFKISSIIIRMGFW